MLGDAKKCCDDRNKTITDLRRGMKVGRKTAQITSELNRQSNEGKMSEWKAERTHRQNMDIASSWSPSAVANMGDLTPASREMNAAVDANRRAFDQDIARSFRSSMRMSTARADKTKTGR